MEYPEKDHRSWNDRMVAKFNPDKYHCKSFFLIRVIEKLRRDIIRRWLAINDHEAVLDVGCGAGNLIQDLDSGHIFGLDLSIFLIQLAQQKNYRASVSFLQSYAESIPFKNNVFDKICCSEVLEHVQDPSLVCKEIGRVLKSNGSFVVSVPNEKFINFVKKALLVRFFQRFTKNAQGYKVAENMLDDWHIHESSVSFLKNLLDPIFIVKKIRFIPFKFFPVRIVALCEKRKTDK